MLWKASLSLAVAGLLVMSACGSPSQPSATARTAVVVDTDMSWDDIAAVAYLLNRDDVNVKAIAIAGDGLTHCDPGFTHVRQLVADLGHPTVPIGCGRTVPLTGSAAFPPGWRMHADSFFGLKLPAVPDQLQMPTAVTVLSDALAASTKTVVIELGPMTNLAETLSLHPTLRGRIERIEAMAGAINVPGNEITQGRAEWNVFIDPLATQTILASGVPVTLVPLDATDDVPVTVFVRDVLKAAGAVPATDLLISLLSDPYYYAGDQYFWDPAAAVVATEPALARTVASRLTVVQGEGPDRGRTAEAGDGSPVDVVQNIDAQGFYDSYLSVVTGNVAVRLTVPDGGLALAYSAGGWSINDATKRIAGVMAVTLRNDTERAVHVVVARIAAGHTAADVDALIRGPVTSVPPWVQIVLDMTTPRGHPATWGVELDSGLYVVVGGAPDIPLERLATLPIT